jgi:hypothetical protein
MFRHAPIVKKTSPNLLLTVPPGADSFSTEIEKERTGACSLGLEIQGKPVGGERGGTTAAALRRRPQPEVAAARMHGAWARGTFPWCGLEVQRPTLIRTVAAPNFSIQVVSILFQIPTASH